MNISNLLKTDMEFYLHYVEHRHRLIGDFEDLVQVRYKLLNE